MKRGYALLVGLHVVAVGLVLVWVRHESRKSPAPRAAALPGAVLDPAALPRRQPRWQVTIPDGAHGLDLVAHPPRLVGDRVIIAGSRVGWVGLTVDGGVVAWRRSASPRLAAPLVLGDELVLLDDCTGAVAADVGDAVLACVTRVNAHDGTIREAGALRATVADVGGCASEPGPWLLAGPAAAVTLGRGPCRFDVELAAGRARRVADRPAAAEADPDLIELEPAQPPWTRRLDGTRSVVVDPTGTRVILGLTALAADPGDRATAAPVTIVRQDASLHHDVLVGRDWGWPLPSPGVDGRADPVAVASTPAAIVVFFDGDRVALFAP